MTINSRCMSRPCPLAVSLRALAAVWLAIALPVGNAAAQQPAAGTPPKVTLKVDADHLALHVHGRLPAGTTGWEYRLLQLRDDVKAAVWSPFPAPPAADGAFRFDVPAKELRWGKLEVRASLQGSLLGATARPAPEPAFHMLTDASLNALPEPQRAAWHAYMLASRTHAEREREILAMECRKLVEPVSKPAPGARAEFELESKAPASSYGTPEAFKLADTVLSYQTPTGGWSKAIDYSAGPRQPGMQWTYNAENPWHYCGTLDNRTTTEQIKFLAHVCNAAPTLTDVRAGVLRGLEWLLAAQYPNGGWPQNYPVEPGYHEAITLNDGAMLHALEVLLSVARGEAPFAFVEESVRQRAQSSYDRGLACLLAAQVRVDGKPAVWCAQHDPLSLAPVAARLKEPPSLSGAESAELLKFLMRKGPTTPEFVTAIEGGIAWLQAHRITGLRKIKTAEGKTDYVQDPDSTEVYWARFYDVTTAAPMFAGAQDGKVYLTFHEMARHNKVAYDYFSTKPADVVGKEMERWRKRVGER